MGDDRTGGVEHHSVPDRAPGTAQHRAHRGRVGLRIASSQLVKLGARKPESGGIKRQLIHAARRNAPDRARGGGGQLVQPIVAVYHQHTGPARSKHPGHHFGEVGERASDQSSPGPGRIGQRPEKIEHGGHTDLAAYRGRVPVGGMEPRREAEPDPNLREAARDQGGSQVDAHPQRLQRVGATGQRGRRSVAVLDHRHTRSRHHNRRHGG
ncbi:hypothetical protein IZ84_11715 [Mycobacterium tuberculosis]|nr:hypothetical protein IZ84_11715 [Mycobacterium tuberculosis]KMX98055.1 hypothetical protein AC434_08055 [Mycobacterium tuberculosis]